VCSDSQLAFVNSQADAAHRMHPDTLPVRPMCLHTMSDQQIAAFTPQLLQRDLVFQQGRIGTRIPAGTPFYTKDLMVLRLIQENLGRRPIYFALTAGNANRMGMDRFVSQEGLAFRLHEDTVRVDNRRLVSGMFGPAVDVERTAHLLNRVYRYAGLCDVDELKLEPTDDNIAGNLAFVYMALADAYRQTGRVEDMIAAYERAGHLSPSPEIQRFLQSLRGLGSSIPGLDSGGTAPPVAPESGQ